MKPLLTLLTIAFCLKPIETIAIDGVDPAFVKQAIEAAAWAGYEEGKLYGRDELGLVRLSLEDIEDLM